MGTLQKAHHCPLLHAGLLVFGELSSDYCRDSTSCAQSYGLGALRVCVASYMTKKAEVIGPAVKVSIMSSLPAHSTWQIRLQLAPFPFIELMVRLLWPLLQHTLQHCKDTFHRLS
jgi:hypothetical protein